MGIPESASYAITGFRSGDASAYGVHFSFDGILYFNLTMPNELPNASAEAVLCNIFTESSV